MAAPAFVQAGAGVVVTSGNANATLSGAVAGNIVILHVLEDGATGLQQTHLSFSYTNVEALDGTDSAMDAIVTSGSLGSGSFPNASQAVRIGRVISNGTVTVNIATSGNDAYGRLYEFSGVNAGTTLADVIENTSPGVAATGEGTSTAINDVGVDTLGADRLALNLVAVNDDNPLGAFTGMTGGTWAEAAAEYETATGTDGAIQLQTATIASAGTINGGSFTMAASDSWGVVGFALIPPTSSGPQDVPVNALASAGAFGTAGIAVGGVSVSPSSLASAAALGAVIPMNSFAVVGLGSAAAFGSPTPVPGGVSRTLTGLGSAGALGAISIAVGGVDVPVSALASDADFGLVVPMNSFSVAGLASASTFGSPTAVPGGVSRTMSGLASAGAFGTPQAIPGPVAVVLVALASAGSFGTPSADSTTRVGVVGLDSAGTFGTPVVLPGAVTREMLALVSAGALGSVTAIGGPTTIPVSALASAAALGSPSASAGEGSQSVDVTGLGSAGVFGTPGILAGGTVIAVIALDSAAAFGAFGVDGGAGPTFLPAIHGGTHRRSR